MYISTFPLFYEFRYVTGTKETDIHKTFVSDYYQTFVRLN